MSNDNIARVLTFAPTAYVNPKTGEPILEATMVEEGVKKVFIPNAAKKLSVVPGMPYRCVIGRFVGRRYDVETYVVDAAAVDNARAQRRAMTAQKLEQAREATKAAAAAARQRSLTAGKDPNFKGGGNGEGKNKNKQKGKR